MAYLPQFAAQSHSGATKGLKTTPVLRELFYRLGIELPITDGMHDLAASLLGRQPTRE